MGWFSWLQKTEEEHAKYLPEDRGLPTPTRPAPPMPACKPPKESEHATGVSEPVITLLKMLERDEWELITHYKEEFGSQGYTTKLTNIYNEDIIVSVSSTVVHYIGLVERVELMDWLTEEESKTVYNAVARRARATSTLNLTNQKEITREKFGKLIGAPDGLV